MKTLVLCLGVVFGPYLFFYTLLACVVWIQRAGKARSAVAAHWRHRHKHIGHPV